MKMLMNEAYVGKLLAFIFLILQSRVWDLGNVANQVLSCRFEDGDYFPTNSVLKNQGTTTTTIEARSFTIRVSSHPKYEQLNALRDQNKNTRVVVYRRYTSTFHTSTHLFDTCEVHGVEVAIGSRVAISKVTISNEHCISS